MTSTKDRSGRPAELLKVDSRGRVKITTERREALLDEFERSGMSGARFSKHYGLHYSTFANWAQARRRKKATVAEAAPSPFLLVSTEAPAAGASLSIDLPGGVRLTVSNREEALLAAALIDALASAR